LVHPEFDEMVGFDFGFWNLDFGFWILDFGFWISTHPTPRTDNSCSISEQRQRQAPAPKAAPESDSVTAL
jgi:hypothetical protein